MTIYKYVTGREPATRGKEGESKSGKPSGKEKFNKSRKFMFSISF